MAKVGDKVVRKNARDMAAHLSINTPYEVLMVHPSGRLLVLKDFLGLVHVDDVEVVEESKIPFTPKPNNTAMAKLLAAFEDFRQEALAAKGDELRKAALEDAAEVGCAIGAIENGLNRNKYDQEHLDAILKGEA